MKKLQGEGEAYRLRVGDFRAIFVMKRIERKIVVSRVRDRKEVY